SAAPPCTTRTRARPASSSTRPSAAGRWSRPTGIDRTTASAAPPRRATLDLVRTRAGTCARRAGSACARARSHRCGARRSAPIAPAERREVVALHEQIEAPGEVELAEAVDARVVQADVEGPLQAIRERQPAQELRVLRPFLLRRLDERQEHLIVHLRAGEELE